MEPGAAERSRWPYGMEQTSGRVSPGASQSRLQPWGGANWGMRPQPGRRKLAVASY